MKLTKEELIKRLDKWQDILNYWEDEIQEVAERYDSMYYMYEKYDRMIEEVYNTIQELKGDSDAL